MGKKKRRERDDGDADAVAAAVNQVVALVVLQCITRSRGF